MTRPAQLALVFVGGALGGATRILVGGAFPQSSGPLPWDLLLINVVGSLLLAAVVARTQARGTFQAFPAVGPGFFGGFTTFSAIACLHWSAGMPAGAAAGVLAATMAAAVAGAFLGWWVGDRPPTPVDEHAVFVEENE